jgi:hypothetical protein
MATTRLQSRAVARFIEPGTSANCMHCGEAVQFRARLKSQQVICNVYVHGRWDRVEHFHRDCYGAAGEPYGAADESQPLRPKATRTVAA